MNGWTPVVTYLGVESSSGTIDSDNQVTVTFANGVPASILPNEISLGFTEAVNNRKVIIYSSAPHSIQQTLAITSSSSVTCSFQGGCEYEVVGNGLTAAIQGDSSSNKINVCERECVIDEAQSTSTSTICTLPSVPTSFSASEYDLATSGNLESVITWTSSTGDETAKVHDGNMKNDFTDSGSSCYIKMDFRTGYAGVLENAKFFINNLIDNSPFVDNLVFEGSDDGSNWTNLWTIDANIHEGWNEFDWEDGEEPAYNSYRFFGSSSGACRVGEVRLNGIEAIQSTATSHTCDVNVLIGGAATAATSVVYDQTSTPSLESISPRFGSVLGGEEITFTGTGFGSSGATVTLDNEDCAVTSQIDT